MFRSTARQLQFQMSSPNGSEDLKETILQGRNGLFPSVKPQTDILSLSQTIELLPRLKLAGSWRSIGLQYEYQMERDRTAHVLPQNVYLTFPVSRDPLQFYSFTMDLEKTNRCDGNLVKFYYLVADGSMKRRMETKECRVVNDEKLQVRFSITDRIQNTDEPFESILLYIPDGCELKIVSVKYSLFDVVSSTDETIAVFNNDVS